MSRVYATSTPYLEELLARAPEANLVPGNAPKGARLAAWARYGYEQWVAAAEAESKLRAYRDIADEEGRDELMRASLERAIQSGIF